MTTMTESEAIEVLLGYDYSKFSRRWESMAKRCDMQMRYVGVCPACRARIEFTVGLSFNGCDTCRELLREYKALTIESDARNARFNNRNV